MSNSKTRVASFFAGIGGFDLGFERNGFKTVYQCELNQFCASVLETRWPKVPRSKNITTVRASDIPQADIWCAGFPCQDVSVARGLHGREGLKGKNSGLFYPFLKLVEEKQPRVIILENVLGLLNSHGGQDFRVVLSELSNLGYTVAWRVMNSRYFGAPQSRPRVFICASRGDPELPLKALYETVKGAVPENRRKGFLTEDKCKTSGASVPRVAYCLAATSGRHTGTDWSRTYISYSNGVRRLTPTECEGLQGFPSGWTDLIDSKATNSDIDTPRYHALGNAVAVPVIEWIAKNIRAAEKTSIRLVNGFSVEEAVEPYLDFSSPKTRSFTFDQATLGENGSPFRWQTGGYIKGQACIDVRAPEAPSQIIEKPLVKVVESARPDDRYFLSPNAAQGIIRRVDNQNRTLFKPMDTALRKMIEEIEAV